MNTITFKRSLSGCDVTDSIWRTEGRRMFCTAPVAGSDSTCTGSLDVWRSLSSRDQILRERIHLLVTDLEHGSASVA
jgi:hypothetical protein